jgi:hypothetical protein
MKERFEKAVGVPVKYELLYVGQWRHNLLLAERFADKRVFLAGDAVHLVIPTGGLGMNGGVGDAIDLGWKLAATLRGWGGPQLLASYEIERRQVGERNVAASRYASEGRRVWRKLWRDPAAMIAAAKIEHPKSNEMIGAELGYRYAGSPLIAEEPGGPEHDFREYRPTTWPGARLPHLWLDGRVAVQDLLGPGYSLLRLGRSEADPSPLESAMRELGAPFDVVDIPEERARELYGFDLIFLRPDMHVVWRGKQMHADPRTLAALATGHRR